MIIESRPLQLSEIENLVDSGDKQKLRLVLNEQHPADLASWLSRLNNPHRLACFRLLDLDNASLVLAELDPDDQKNLLHDLGDIGVVPLIARMPADDAVDLLAELPKEKARSIINQITDKEAKEDIEELMTFAEDSAGGIMSCEYLALNAKMSAGDALATLRERYEEVEEETYDVYVVDEENRLVGKVTVKELLTSPLDALVESIMDDNVVKVTTGTDQEEAAEKLGHYDLLSLPVVDEAGRLHGIITADDVIDVLEEEATEDIYQSSGISMPVEESSETLTYNVPLAFRARLPWLVVTLLIEAGSAVVITGFNQVVREAVVAVSFMPLLSAVTGSAATQSTCIVIRGSATGQIEWSSFWFNAWHETKVGFLLGVACGAITSLLAIAFHYGTVSLGIIVGLSLFITTTFGVLTGTLTPMIFHKIGVEPEHASGPLITSLLDVCTFTIYLSIVKIFMSFVV